MSFAIKKGACWRPFLGDGYFLDVINDARHHGREDYR